MSLARQPLIGDILHIRGQGYDVYANIIGIDNNILKIKEVSRFQLVFISELVWTGKEWIHRGQDPNTDQFFTNSVNIKLLDARQMSYIYNKNQDPRNLQTSQINTFEDEEIQKKLRYELDEIESLNRQLAWERSYKNSNDDEQLAMPVRSQLQRIRNEDQMRREFDQAYKIGGGEKMRFTNPYLSRMPPTQPEKTAYLDNRPGMSQYTNPNQNPKQFRLPKPKM